MVRYYKSSFSRPILINFRKGPKLRLISCQWQAAHWHASITQISLFLPINLLSKMHQFWYGTPLGPRLWILGIYQQVCSGGLPISMVSLLKWSFFTPISITHVLFSTNLDMVVYWDPGNDFMGLTLMLSKVDSPNFDKGHNWEESWGFQGSIGQSVVTQSMHGCIALLHIIPHKFSRGQSNRYSIFNQVNHFSNQSFLKGFKSSDRHYFLHGSPQGPDF